MVSPKALLSPKVLLFVLLAYCSVEVEAQCNPEEGGATCQDAPIVCLNNLCDATEDNPPDSPYNGWCGPSTAIHNPQYFAFIPVVPDVFFTITVGQCMGGQNQLQAGIIGTCPWTGPDEIIDCNPGAGEGSQFTLTALGLVPGQTYYLIFDGSAGAQCDYTIDVASGVYDPELTEDLTDVAAVPSEPVCQGYNGLTLFATPEIGNAHGYWWVPEWTGVTIETTDPELNIDIPPDLDAGTYQVCVRAFSGCDTMDFDICIDIEVYEIPPEVKEPESFCPEEFPFSWGSVNISGPGDYEQTFTTAEGCSFDSTWTVEEYPEVPVGYIDTLHCEETLIYEGNAYDEADIYLLEYPGMGLNGCDSTAELDLTLAAITAYIEMECQNGEFELFVIIEELIPFGADLEYEWYDGATLVSTDIQYSTLDGGTYTCIVTVITSAGECSFPLEPFSFDAAEFRPDPPNLGFLDTLVCAQPGVFFEVIVDPFEEPYTYTWSVTPATVPLFQDGSEIAELDFSNAGPSEVCVYATNECGDGPETCFNVDIKPTPVADFTYDLDLCADSTTTVTFTGSASPDAVITWDFSNPTTITGSGLGPYDVSWAVPGDKVITLTVAEPGCDSSFTSGIVTVSNFIAPVINCTSTINSVSFDWDDVTGANCYLVSINGAPAVSTCTSEYMVSPLNPGDMVQITLTVVSAGPCDDIVLTDNCTAQNCPPPSVSITGQDSACLNNPSIIDLDVIVNGSPGVGTWSGPGIVDPNLGLFDPVVASAGQHQVTFNAIVNNCPHSEPYLITVFDSLTADFTIDPVICITDNATLTFTGNATGSATYDYTFAPANVVSGSGAGPYMLNWNSPGQQTVRLQVSENGCFSDIISQTTNVVATLNPTIINCAPNTSGILFSWTVDPAALDSTVVTLTAQVGVPSGNTLNFTGLTPGDIVGIAIIANSAGPCPDRADTLYCEARQCPMPVITLTPVDDICLYPGTGTINLEVSVTNGNGSGDWSGPGVVDAVNGKFDPVVAGPGAHLVTYHYVDDQCDFFNSITINVYDPPGAFISTTDLMITCTSGSLFLDGSGSSGGTLDYFWSTPTGEILSGGNTPIVEVGAPGVYQLLVTGTTSGCVDSTDVTVTQDSDIPTPVGGPDRTITCDSTQFVLGGNSTSGPNIIYSWSTPDGNIVGPTDGKFITVDAVGEYNLTVVDTVNGCDATDRVLVGIDTAVADIILTAGDTIDCNTTTSTAESSLNEPAANYTFSWTTADGTIVGPANGPDIDVSQGGTFVLTIHNKNNGCENTEDVFVPESDEIIDAVDVSLMNITCHGDNNGALTINSVTGGTPPYTYKWSVSPQGGGMLTSLSPGIYSLTVTDVNGCTFTQSFEVTEPDLVTLDIGPNMTVAVEDSVSLTINTNLAPDAIAAITWGGYDGIFCPGCPTFSFIATSSATISAMISDTAGCEAFDSMRLTVIVPRIIYIPNIFSPNEDGINDYFYISGRSNLVGVGYLRIFDRWGNQLFENKDRVPGNEQDGWDGTFDGQPMQPGVYVYAALLEYEDGFSETVTGEVTIIR